MSIQLLKKLPTPTEIKADYPEIPAYEEYDELLTAIRNAMK